jgi:uncharacterized membrane protein YkvA (DUF1232 family)
MGFIEYWRQKARGLKKNSLALYFAARDPRVPWYAKAVIAIVAAYAFSPIDLIPDFIPIFGYLDDLVLVPLGIAFAIRLMPPVVWQECVTRAEQTQLAQKPRSLVAAAVIVVIWIAVLIAGTYLFLRHHRA